MRTLRRVRRTGTPVRALLLALVLVLVSSCSPLSSVRAEKMTITAYFPSVSGLFVGNDVGILGVTVGEVTAIKAEGTKVKVTLAVDDSYDVPADAGAVVVARSVATDRYVELTPVYRSGAKMTDGDTISQDRTRNPVEFDEVLATLNTFATGIAGSKESKQAIKKFIDSGSAALDGNGELFNDTVGDLAGAVGSVNDKRENISATLRSLDTLVGTIAANQQTARTFISQVAKVSSQLNDERVNFRTALRSLDSALTTVADFADAHRKEIVDTIGSTTTLFKTVLSRQQDLTEILETFPLALQNLDRAGQGPRIPVRIPALSLLPVAGLLNQVCQGLPGSLCDLISGTDPNNNKQPAGRRGRR